MADTDVNMDVNIHNDNNDNNSDDEHSVDNVFTGGNSDDSPFNEKLLKGVLDIQQTLNNLVLKFDSQSTEISTIKNDLYSRDGIEDRLQAVTSETNDQTTEICELKAENDKLSLELCNMKSYVTHLESRLDVQQCQINSLVERSMRENAIVTGVEETRDENVKEILLEIFKNTLKIKQPIKIDRAHRIGLKSNDKPPRPIVVKFHDYNEREMIINAARTISKNNKQVLKGVYVQPQFPDNMREQRKRLIALQKEYEEKSVETQIKGNRLVFKSSGTAHVDKICIPKAAVVLDTAESRHGKFQLAGSEVLSDNNHTYCATASAITTYAEVREVARQILQTRVSSNTYNTLIYRFTDKDGKTHDGFDDDGDYGTGSRILAFLKEIDMTNIAIVSSRTPPAGTAKITQRNNTIIMNAVKSVLRKM